MSSKIRIIAFFLALTCVLLIASSCSKSDVFNNEATIGIESTTSFNTTEKTEIPDGLPDYDFGGKIFTIIALETPINQITAEGDSSEVIEDAVYKRNLAVSERFNIAIKSLIYPYSQFDSSFRASVMSGDNNIQFAAMHIINSGVYATDGLLTDWNTIPNIDLGKPWWNQTVVKNMQIGGKLYLEQNDIPTYTVVSYNHAMFFNKNILDDLDIPNIYNTVLEGKWTLDLLAEYSAMAAMDIDGNGAMSTADIWGFITSEGAISSFLPASNQPIMQTNDAGIPKLVLNTPRMCTLVEKVYDICFASGNTYMEPNTEENELMLMFKNGHSLFYNGFIADCFALRDMEDEFGLIPLPKFNEQQEGYYTQVRGDTNLVGIPVSVPEEDYEFIGTIVEALSSESYKMVRPAIYESALKTKFLRDKDSVEMLDILTKNIVVDFGLVFHNWKAFGFPLWDLAVMKSNDFASYYESKEATAIENYNTVIEKILSTD